ncbi:MAG: YkgJ family cysteine cluster protein [Polyangiaceae bacterium]|nr:YkgJ family cysteine cluster protein [Polyangiaceae bacterium]
MAAKRSLVVLDAEIDARVADTRRAHGYWPCKEGCDLCCRSLPRLPVITEPEWRRLRVAIDRLDASVVEQVRARLSSAPERGPLTCPLLDPERGACLVYEARPIACRTYGYYTERDAGLHCERVTRAIDEHGEGAAILWGNGEAILRELDEHGEAVSLREWMT